MIWQSANSLRCLHNRGMVTDKLDTDDVISRIQSGETQRTIAKHYGVSVGSLNGWLHAEPERSTRARAAMADSAEAWLDRGLAAIEDALPDAVEIARARLMEQHCARRAAIRNPRYSDKLAIGGAEDMPPIKTMSDDQIMLRIKALNEKLRNAD